MPSQNRTKSLEKCCIGKTSRQPWMKTCAFSTQLVIFWTALPPLPLTHNEWQGMKGSNYAIVSLTEGWDHFLPIHLEGSDHLLPIHWLLGHVVFFPQGGQAEHGLTLQQTRLPLWKPSAPTAPVPSSVMQLLHFVSAHSLHPWILKLLTLFVHKPNVFCLRQVPAACHRTSNFRRPKVSNMPRRP